MIDAVDDTGGDERIVDARTGAVIGAAMVVASASNYGFQIVCGRALSVEQYGLLAGFMSVVTVMTVAGTALQTTVARALATGARRPRPGVLDGLTRSALRTAGVVAVVAVVLSPLASRWLDVGTAPVALLGVYAASAVLDSIALGRLQGLQWFRAMGGYSLGQAVAKLGVAGVALELGADATGVLLGLVLSSAAVAVAGMVSSSAAGAVDTRVVDPDVRRAFAGFTMLWLILGIDVVCARARFGGDAAGIYGAGAVLGKAVLWVPSVVAQLVFPRLAKRSGRGESSDALVARAALVVAGVVGASVVALYALGEPVFRLLYGDRYTGAADVAWKIGVAVAPLALANLLMLHFLARGDGRFLRAMAVVLVAEVVSLIVGPTDVGWYAATLFVAGVVLVGSMVPGSVWRQLLRRDGAR